MTPSWQGSLSEVSRTSVRNCWTVETVDSNNRSPNFAEHGNGTAWSSL
jgi:hypothetical protein